MPNKSNLVETLRTTSEALKVIRRRVAGSGHLAAMTDIDTLVQVAQEEADKMITSAERGVTER